MPSPIISPQSSQQTISVQEVSKTSQITPIIPLDSGENLDIRVLGYDRDNKVLLQIKNFTLAAESQLPLRVGEKLTVRVDQLHPSVVLRVITPEDSDISRVNESLRMYRSNPTALRDMIITVKNFFSGANLKELSNLISGQSIQAIHKVLEHIIISKTNVSNSLFLKDYITALGLILESGLMKAITARALPENDKSSQTLKETLLKLSSELRALQAAPDSSDLDSQQKIKQLSDFVDHSLSVIESLQIVNVLAQEQDNLYTLQIPFQCPDTIRMQNIFIETDREKNGHDPGKQYRIVLFLDMDALGEVAVDAGIRDGSLRCTIKCENQGVLDFMSALLPELQDGLAGIGYASYVQCTLDKDLRAWELDFLSDHRLFSQNSIDLSI
jgi:hypothetical protein